MDPHDEKPGTGWGGSNKTPGKGKGYGEGHRGKRKGIPWIELGRLMSLTSGTILTWSSIWAFVHRKFFWDMIGGILGPAGLIPPPSAHIFIKLIVQVPFFQTINLINGLLTLCISYPLPTPPFSSTNPSFATKNMLPFLQSFFDRLSLFRKGRGGRGKYGRLDEEEDYGVIGRGLALTGNNQRTSREGPTLIERSLWIRVAWLGWCAVWGAFLYQTFDFAFLYLLTIPVYLMAYPSGQSNLHARLETQTTRATATTPTGGKNVEKEMEILHIVNYNNFSTNDLPNSTTPVGNESDFIPMLNVKSNKPPSWLVEGMETEEKLKKKDQDGTGKGFGLGGSGGYGMGGYGDVGPGVEWGNEDHGRYYPSILGKRKNPENVENAEKFEKSGASSIASTSKSLIDAPFQNMKNLDHRLPQSSDFNSSSNPNPNPTHNTRRKSSDKPAGVVKIIALDKQGLVEQQESQHQQLRHLRRGQGGLRTSRLGAAFGQSLFPAPLAGGGGNSTFGPGGMGGSGAPTLPFLDFRNGGLARKSWMNWQFFGVNQQQQQGARRISRGTRGSADRERIVRDGKREKGEEDRIEKGLGVDMIKGRERRVTFREAGEKGPDAEAQESEGLLGRSRLPDPGSYKHHPSNSDHYPLATSSDAPSTSIYSRSSSTASSIPSTSASRDLRSASISRQNGSLEYDSYSNNYNYDIDHGSGDQYEDYDVGPLGPFAGPAVPPFRASSLVSKGKRSQKEPQRQREEADDEMSRVVGGMEGKEEDNVKAPMRPNPRPIQEMLPGARSRRTSGSSSMNTSTTTMRRFVDRFGYGRRTSSSADAEEEDEEGDEGVERRSIVPPWEVLPPDEVTRFVNSSGRR